MTVLLEGLQ